MAGSSSRVAKNSLCYDLFLLPGFRSFKQWAVNEVSINRLSRMSEPFNTNIYVGASLIIDILVVGGYFYYVIVVSVSSGYVLDSTC
jgi:hypothetical protein